MGRTTLRQSLINKSFAETANEEHIFEVNSSSIENLPLENNIFLFLA